MRCASDRRTASSISGPRRTRPRQPKDQRYENAYLFGAVCPARDTGVALIMPNADTDAMQKHIDEIGRAVARGAHALIILDKAGWHTTGKLKVPNNLTLVLLPPACPELNSAENIWQYLRQTYLSNRVFQTYTDILDACQTLRSAPRRGRSHRLNRNPRFGSHRSIILKAGIKLSSTIALTSSSHLAYHLLTIFPHIAAGIDPLRISSTITSLLLALTSVT